MKLKIILIYRGYRRSENSFKSPEQFKDYPKAEPCKTSSTRKEGRSILATDTPEKDAIQEKSLVRINTNG